MVHYFSVLLLASAALELYVPALLDVSVDVNHDINRQEQDISMSLIQCTWKSALDIAACCWGCPGDITGAAWIVGGGLA